MSNSPTKEFFSKAGLGYARHKIVMDDAGTPCDYRFVEVNDVFERIAGLNAGSITGKTVNEIVAQTEAPIFDWIGAYGEVAKKGAAGEFEQFFATPKRWFKVRAFSPDPNQFVTIFTDISGQKSSEEALLESETRFKQVAELIGEGIGIVDKDEVFRFVNPAANKIFEVEPEGLIGRSLREFLDEENYNKIIDETSKRKRKEQTSYELLITTDKGNQRHLFVTATPMTDSSGDTTGTFGVFFDITERKAAEEELRKFKTIADKANYGSVITNMHGDILYVNDYYAKMHGWEKEELVGKSFSLLHPEELAQEVTALLDILKDKVSLNAVEFTNRRKDGATFYTLNNATLLLDKNNNPEMVASTAIDITEDKAARHELHKLTQAIRQSPVSIVITNIKA